MTRRVYDCKSCGLCCVAHSWQDGWADVNEADFERLGAIGETLYIDVILDLSVARWLQNQLSSRPGRSRGAM